MFQHLTKWKVFFGNYRFVPIICKLSSGKEIGDYLERIYKNYPSICSIWFLGRPNVYCSSPEYVEVLLKSVQHIRKGNEYYIFTDWLGKGLLTSAGAKWHANRKLLTPAFHFRILESCFPIFNSNANILIKLLKENSVNYRVLDVEKFISLCSLDIISESAMGVTLNAQLNQHSDYVKAVRRMGELCLDRVKTFYLIKDWIFYLTRHGREQKKLLNTLHNFTENVIKASKKKRLQEKRGKGHKPAAFVDILLEMAEQNTGSFTDFEIREEVDTFIFEGHETTSSSICWSILLLGNHQEVQERAYNEQISIFGAEERDVTRQDIIRMTYLEAVIKESLRLFPPVSYLSRKLDFDMKIENYTVPSGTNAIVIPYFLHRKSDNFPQPEKFDPERWLFTHKDINKQPFMYIPFSAGPRNCIGQRFAMLEMKVVLSNILRSFKIEAVTKMDGIKVLLSPILRPLNGTHIKLQQRE